MPDLVEFLRGVEQLRLESPLPGAGDYSSHPFGEVISKGGGKLRQHHILQLVYVVDDSEAEKTRLVVSSKTEALYPPDRHRIVVDQPGDQGYLRDFPCLEHLQGDDQDPVSTRL